MLNLLPLICFVYFGISSLYAQENQPLNNSQQQISVFDNKLEFTGWRGHHENTENLKEIRIGLFLPETASNNIDFSINKGADLAIEELNKSGGYQGLPYRLIRRRTNDPWGAGSKEMIKLVYEDSVWAVVGSLDGDATHIAEQIVTKAFLPLISPLSADPTLNYIRIPWIFRLTPDYQTQAALIVEQCAKKSDIQRIGLISTTSHDGRVFSKEIKDALKEYNQSLVFHFQVTSNQIDISQIIQRALTFQADGLILFLANHEIENIISELKDKNFRKPVIIPWIPDLNMALFTSIVHENIFLVEPFSFSKNPAWNMFRQNYMQRFGVNPSSGTVFVYDAIYLLAHAIEKAGLNRAAIRDAIAKTDYSSPVTGKIVWDNTGGRIIQPVLRKMDISD
jgi:ABC-type branched-subunit amino acid transport system substrate-binding protein